MGGEAFQAVVVAVVLVVVGCLVGLGLGAAYCAGLTDAGRVDLLDAIYYTKVWERIDMISRVATHLGVEQSVLWPVSVGFGGEKDPEDTPPPR